jgi:hypothetical protein
MTLQVGDTPPSYSDPWRITHLGRRVKWRGGKTRCTVCRQPVALDSRHYYAELSSAAGRGRATPDEEVVFCTRGCLSDWGEEAG